MAWAFGYGGTFTNRGAFHTQERQGAFSHGGFTAAT